MKTLAAVFLFLSVTALAERPANNRLPPAIDYALSKVTEITIYSLDPAWLPPSERRSPDFHSHIILGSSTLSSPADLEAVRTTIRKDVSTYDDTESTCCFNPRHGFRFRIGLKVFDILVCYEFTKLIAYIGGDGANDAAEPRILGVSGRPTVFDEILKAQGVLLPPPAVLK